MTLIGFHFFCMWAGLHGRKEYLFIKSLVFIACFCIPSFLMPLSLASSTILPAMPSLLSLLRLWCNQLLLPSWSSLSVSLLSSQASQGKVYWSLGNARVPLKVKVNKSKASCRTTKPNSASGGGASIIQSCQTMGHTHPVTVGGKMWTIRKKVSTERPSHIGESSQPRGLPLLLGLTVTAGSAMVAGKVMLARIPFQKKMFIKNIVVI